MDKDYRQGDTIYLLMDAESASSLLADWAYHNYECDLVLHRSKKTKGCMVVETKDVMWASRIIRWHHPKKVTYKSR